MKFLINNSKIEKNVFFPFNLLIRFFKLFILGLFVTVYIPTKFIIKTILYSLKGFVYLSIVVYRILTFRIKNLNNQKDNYVNNYEIYKFKKVKLPEFQDKDFNHKIDNSYEIHKSQPVNVKDYTNLIINESLPEILIIDNHDSNESENSTEGQLESTPIEVFNKSDLKLNEDIILKEKKPINIKKILLILPSLINQFLKYSFKGLIIVSILFNKFIIKKIFYGVIVVCYFIFKVAYFSFKGLILPLYIIKSLFYKISFYNERDKFNKLFTKAQDRLLKEQLKEDEERERIRREKRLSEPDVAKREDIYSNKKVKIKGHSFKDQILKFFNQLISIPKKIKEKYNNSLFVKSKKNRYNIEREALMMNFEGKDAEKTDIKLMYEYVAKDPNGKVIKGYFEAFSKVEVHSFLLSEKYEVYSIRTSKWIRFLYAKKGNSSVKIKTKDLIFFLTQLSTYIKAGIPLVDALKILSRQFKNRNYQKVFKSIMYDLTMGENFSEALHKQGKAFPKLLINMIKAAEMTGELPEALDDMAEYFTESDKTRKQMITAMMYPSIVFVFATAAIVFIMMFVVPKFVEIYESMDASKIPAFTRFVVNVSEFLGNYFVFILIGIAILIILFIYMFKNIKFFRTIIQWIAMHIPVFGNVIIYNEVTMFTKTFSSLLSHNVYITDSMDVLNRITNNEIYKMLILSTINNLAKGEKISLAFKDHWAFPIPAYEMLVTGEQTGELPEMMRKVSTYYQELHKNSVGRIKTFIEPALLIFLTVVVGGIVLSIVIPMFGFYDLSNNLG